MNFIGGLLDRFRREDSRAIPDKPIEKSLVQQVWEGPALFNRETRRRAGITSKVWRWDLKPLGDRVFIPRYVRRHFDKPAGTFLSPKTRRQRRHRARIARLTIAKGL